MNNDKAIEAFLNQKAIIHAQIARLQALSEDHFNVDPDSINWSHVGTLQHLAEIIGDAERFAS